VAVRVGQVPITTTTVEHWMSTLAGGRIPSEPSRRQALRRQALDFLISSEWLISEAARDHLRLADAEVESSLKRKQRASFPGGEAELHEFLTTTGQTPADMTLEARAELASAKIRQLLVSRESPITQKEITGYYNRHQQRFLVPEQRAVQITNRKSAAEVDTLKRSLESGKSFASFSQQESFVLSPAAYSTSRGSDSLLTRAIHSARTNVLTGPVKQRVDYYLFVVTRIIPAREQGLAQVQNAIRQQLAAEQRQRSLAAFIAAWRARWTARTDCRTGYVVRKCRQYHASGVTPPEDPYSFD